MKKELTLLISTLIFTTVYAVLRYVVFKDVDVDYLALYVLNKSFSLSVVLLIPYILIKNNKLLVNSFNVLILLHIAVSLFLFDAQHYNKFFTNAGNYSITAMLTVLFGAVSAIIFLSWHFKKIINISSRTRLIIFIFFTASHTFVMGVNSWFSPQTWPGYMPPITLVAFISATYSLQFVVAKNYLNPLIKKILLKSTKNEKSISTI